MTRYGRRGSSSLPSCRIRSESEPICMRSTPQSPRKGHNSQACESSATLDDHSHPQQHRRGSPTRTRSIRQVRQPVGRGAIAWLRLDQVREPVVLTVIGGGGATYEWRPHAEIALGQRVSESDILRALWNEDIGHFDGASWATADFARVINETQRAGLGEGPVLLRSGPARLHDAGRILRPAISRRVTFDLEPDIPG